MCQPRNPDSRTAAGAGAEPVLLLARDLIMQSRVLTAARRLNVPVQVLRDPGSLGPDRQGAMLIADLDLDGALEAATAWREATSRPAAGFVQHVHANRIRAAREAGIERIIPRSRLDAALTELLSAATHGSAGD